MTILVTGGAGYIGSHTCVELIQAGYDVLILDNFSNAKPEVLNRIEGITGIRPGLAKGDVADAELLNIIFRENDIEVVIHFAGYKAVGESMAFPLKYYQNNLAATITLCEVMAAHECFKFVFSSSATVYGEPDTPALREDFPLRPANTYGRTKFMVEEVLRDAALADERWDTALLRYFNPVGAHHTGKIGEDPEGIPNNLMPYVAQVASGKLECLSIFGNDYPTPDGTGIRDYIHVVDLAQGHLTALQKITKDSGNHGCVAYNLGTGHGYSVLDVVNTFQRVTEQTISYKFAERRAGDIAEFFADPTFTAKELGWKTKYTLEEMVRDHWNWQKQNPMGY